MAPLQTRLSIALGVSATATCAPLAVVALAGSTADYLGSAQLWAVLTIAALGVAVA